MAAVTLKLANPGYVDRLSTGKDALDKELDALIMRYNNIPIQGSQFFRNVTAKAGLYKESTFGNQYQLPVLSEDADPVPYVNPVPGFPKTFTVAQYRLGVRAERTLSEQELFPFTKRAMSGLMTTSKLLYEYSFASHFNNATNASYEGADGVALASATHPHERRQTGTWSNLSTTAALTHPSFSLARTALRKRTSEFGYPMVVSARKLVVSPDLEEQARVIVASEQKSGTTFNDKNVFKGSVEVVVWDYLTSTTAWFLMGDIPMENCGMVIAEDIKPSIAPCTGTDISTDIIWAERLRMRFVTGFTVEKNLQYNAGA
jgi:hypothetical protein